MTEPPLPPKSMARLHQIGRFQVQQVILWGQAVTSGTLARHRLSWTDDFIFQQLMLARFIDVVINHERRELSMRLTDKGWSAIGGHEAVEAMERLG